MPLLALFLNHKRVLSLEMIHFTGVYSLLFLAFVPHPIVNFKVVMGNKLCDDGECR